MSKLNVDAIAHTGSGTDNITLDASGNVDVAGGITATSKVSTSSGDGFWAGGDVLAGNAEENIGSNLYAGLLAMQRADASSVIQIKKTGTAVPTFNVTADGNVVASGDVQMASQNSGPLAGFRNQLINGSMEVWQRGTDFDPPADLAYTADRWSGAYNRTRVLKTTNAPSGFNYSMAMYGAGGGQDRRGAGQAVELARTGHAGQFVVGTTWTFSFYMTADTGSGSVDVKTRFTTDVAGTDLVEIAATTVNYDTTWKRYSLTFTIDKSPAASNTGFSVTIDQPSCPAGQVLSLTGCQLEPGPVATPFEHRPIATELQLCKRYYQYIDYHTNNGGLSSLDAGWYRYPIQLPVQMRTAPDFESSDTGGSGDAQYVLYDGTTGTGFVATNLYDTGITFRGDDANVTRSLVGRVKLSAEL